MTTRVTEGLNYTKCILCFQKYLTPSKEGFCVSCRVKKLDSKHKQKKTLNDY